MFLTVLSFLSVALASDVPVPPVNPPNCGNLGPLGFNCTTECELAAAGQ